MKSQSQMQSQSQQQSQPQSQSQSQSPQRTCRMYAKEPIRSYCYCYYCYYCHHCRRIVQKRRGCFHTVPHHHRSHSVPRHHPWTYTLKGPKSQKSQKDQKSQKSDPGPHDC